MDDEGKDEHKGKAEGIDKDKDKQKNVERGSPFAMHDRLGYLTTCPSNLGSAFRASIDLCLPHLTKVRYYKDCSRTWRMQRLLAAPHCLLISEDVCT